MRESTPLAPTSKNQSTATTIALSAALAGTVATVAQMLLWWLFGHPLPDILYRDSRLAAAILMGTAVLTPSDTFNRQVMLVATLVHLGLSLAYAAALHVVLRRTVLPWFAQLSAGLCFGLLIFAINMYGFTGIFPWFAATRDWITLTAHGVFGVVLAWGLKACSVRHWHWRLR